jgi:hypothetical integral membrane protein (TIGR02206 family)
MLLLAQAGWPDGFEPFTLPHAVSSIAFAGLAIAVVALGHRWQGTSRETVFRGVFAGAVAISQVLMVAYWAEPTRFAWGESLPLHMCDLTAWLVPVALTIRARWMLTVVFFWGLGLTTQAFVQPTLTHGIHHGVYWFFWVQHAAILAGGVYAWVVLGYRPRARDFGLAVGISAAFGLTTAIVNWQTGWMYFFTGPDLPANETILDHLGPWPGRVVWMYVIAVAVMGSLWGLAAVAARVFDRAAPEPEREPASVS